MAEDQEGWTVILQAASGFGWLASSLFFPYFTVPLASLPLAHFFSSIETAAFGTWLLLPAWWHIIQEKPRNFSWKVFQYFVRIASLTLESSWRANEVLSLAI